MNRGLIKNEELKNAVCKILNEKPWHLIYDDTIDLRAQINLDNDVSYEPIDEIVEADQTSEESREEEFQDVEDEKDDLDEVLTHNDNEIQVKFICY